MAKKKVTIHNYEKIGAKLAKAELLRSFRSPIVTIFYWIVICSYSVMAIINIVHHNIEENVPHFFYVLGYSVLLFFKVRLVVICIIIPGAMLWALDPDIILKITGLLVLALTFVVMLIKWPGAETTEWKGLHSESN